MTSSEIILLVTVLAVGALLFYLQRKERKQ